MVRKIDSPKTTGEECASPASGTRHRTLWPEARSHSVGVAKPSDTPWANGPRKEGQSTVPSRSAPCTSPPQAAATSASVHVHAGQPRRMRSSLGAPCNERKSDAAPGPGEARGQGAASSTTSKTWASGPSSWTGPE